MNPSLRAVCRAIRVPSATRLTGQSLTQTRRLTSTTTSEYPGNRDAAVHDAIMDKLWGAGTTQSASASASANLNAASSTTTTTETPAQATLGATETISEPIRH